MQVTQNGGNQEAEKPQRTKILLKWFKKNLFHIVASLSPNPVTFLVAARTLLGFQAETTILGASSEHLESDISELWKHNNQYS